MGDSQLQGLDQSIGDTELSGEEIIGKLCEFLGGILRLKVGVPYRSTMAEKK